MALVAAKLDITQLAVDAIVNAANRSLLGGGGVDGAIHRAAGPALLDACRELNGCMTGEAKITQGFALPARFVIHTVGPVWHGGEQREAELLSSCYASCFKIAAEYEIKTIAFPAISCGVYGYPWDDAVDIAIDAASATLKSNTPIETITFACFSDEMLDLYQRRLDNDRDATSSTATGAGP